MILSTLRAIPQAIPPLAAISLAVNCAYKVSNKSRLEDDNFFGLISLIAGLFLRAYQIGSPLFNPLTFVFSSSIAYLTTQKCVEFANRYPPFKPSIHLCPNRANEIRKNQLVAARDTAAQWVPEIDDYISSDCDILDPDVLKFAEELIENQILKAVKQNNLPIFILFIPSQNEAIEALRLYLLEIKKVRAAISEDSKLFNIHWSVSPQQQKLQTLIALNLIGLLILKATSMSKVGRLGYIEIAGLVAAFFAISIPKFIEFKRVFTDKDLPNIPFLKKLELKACFPAYFANVPEDTNCTLCLDEINAGRFKAIVPFGCNNGHVFHPECITPWIRKGSNHFKPYKINSEYKVSIERPRPSWSDPHDLTRLDLERHLADFQNLNVSRAPENSRIFSQNFTAFFHEDLRANYFRDRASDIRFREIPPRGPVPQNISPISLSNIQPGGTARLYPIVTQPHNIRAVSVLSLNEAPQQEATPTPTQPTSEASPPEGEISNLKYTAYINPANFPTCPNCRNTCNPSFVARATAQHSKHATPYDVKVDVVLALPGEEAT